jgi:BMFP domain-containing protein YqiC
LPPDNHWLIDVTAGNCQYLHPPGDETMVKPEKIDEFIHQFTALLPADLRQARQDMEKNLKAAMTAALARMDLVTREEFDVQTELLARSRALLAELESKISHLEEQLKQKKE